MNGRQNVSRGRKIPMRNGGNNQKALFSDEIGPFSEYAMSHR